MHVYELDHPYGQYCLAQLRKRHLPIDEFRQYGNILVTFLLTEATKNLQLKDENSRTFSIDDDLPVFLPVLRAGLSLLDIALKLFPKASVGILGAERDESTAEASVYYKKFPTLEDKHVIILEPMLATGGTLSQVIQNILKDKPRAISIVSVIASLQGIQALSAFDNISLQVAAIDPSLDERKYIVPGLGDFGDRWFGTNEI